MEAHTLIDYIKPIFAWYDLWIGAYWDQAKRRLYVLPLPRLGS